jgi:hypothetical protein
MAQTSAGDEFVLATTSEGLIVGLVGGILGAATGSLVGLAGPAAVVAGVNGVISGHRKIYDWRSPRGVLAMVLDSTWAVPTTAAGLAAHVVAATQSTAGYSTSLSERQNRHVYGRGLVVRKGFATTLGNVVNGAGDVSRARRAKLITDHEDVHVWQARWFGPLYPVLYGGWMVGGAVAGAASWLFGRRDAPFGKVVESCAYYLNPFEWWAYSRDDHWPPSGKVAGIGWPKPAVRSFASFRADRAT